MLAQVNCK